MNQTLFPEKPLEFSNRTQITSSRPFQFRLFHIDKYELAKRIVQRKKVVDKEKDFLPINLLKMKVKTQIQSHQAAKQAHHTSLKQQSKLNYEQHSFLNGSQRKGSAPFKEKLNNSFRVSSKRTKRMSTDSSNYKQFYSVTRIDTDSKEYEDISQDKILERIKTDWKNSILSRNLAFSDKEESSLTQSPLKLSKSKKKMTINEFVDLRNSQQRKYQQAKCSKIGIIPDSLRYQGAKLRRGQRILIQTVSSKVYSHYKLNNPSTIQY